MWSKLIAIEEIKYFLGEKVQKHNKKDSQFSPRFIADEQNISYSYHCNIQVKSVPHYAGQTHRNRQPLPKESAKQLDKHERRRRKSNQEKPLMEQVSRELRGHPFVPLQTTC